MSAGGAWHDMIERELAELAELLGVEQLQLNDHGGITLTREQLARYEQLVESGAWPIERDMPVCLHD